MSTLRDILVSSSGLKCSLITGYEGINREVKVITALESPKSVEKLTGGEFVLSSGVVFGEHIGELYEFVLRLINKGCAGLGIKTRFISDIPEDVLELAGMNNFPLILLPDDCLWSEFFGPFFRADPENNSRVIDSNMLRENMQEFVRLGKMGASMLNPRFLELMCIAAIITDNDYNVLARNQHPEVDVLLGYVTDEASRPWRAAYSNANKVNGQNFGIYHFLHYKNRRITDIKISDEQHLLLENTSKGLSTDEIELLQINYMNLLKTEESQDTLDQIMDRILDDLSKNQTLLKLDDLISQKQFKASTFVVFFYSGDTPDEFNQHLQKALENQTIFTGTRIFSRRLDDQNFLAMLITTAKVDNKTDWTAELNKVFLSMETEKTHQKLYLGESVKFAGDIPNSYRQAAQCKKYGQVICPSDPVLFYHDIDCIASLSHIDVNLEMLTSLDDSITNFNACETLEAFLEHKNIKQAAKAIFIHENTMRYRLAKVEKVLRTDLQSLPIALNLLIKLKIYRLFKGNALGNIESDQT